MRLRLVTVFEMIGCYIMWQLENEQVVELSRILSLNEDRSSSTPALSEKRARVSKFIYSRRVS